MKTLMVQQKQHKELKIPHFLILTELDGKKEHFFYKKN